MRIIYYIIYCMSRFVWLYIGDIEEAWEKENIRLNSTSALFDFRRIPWQEDFKYAMKRDFYVFPLNSAIVRV